MVGASEFVQSAVRRIHILAHINLSAHPGPMVLFPMPWMTDQRPDETMTSNALVNPNLYSSRCVCISPS